MTAGLVGEGFALDSRKDQTIELPAKRCHQKISVKKMSLFFRELV